MYRHSPGSVRPPSCSYWQVIYFVGHFVSIERPDIVHEQVSPLPETVLDSIDISHGCQGPSNAYNRYPQQSTVFDPLFKPRQV